MFNAPAPEKLRKRRAVSPPPHAVDSSATPSPLQNPSPLHDPHELEELIKKSPQKSPLSPHEGVSLITRKNVSFSDNPVDDEHVDTSRAASHPHFSSPVKNKAAAAVGSPINSLTRRRSLQIDARSTESSDYDNDKHTAEAYRGTGSNYTDDSLSDGEGGGGSHSDASGSTKDSTTRIVKRISDRPMTVYMTIIVLVPIIFLVAYQAEISARAIETSNFINDRLEAVKLAFQINREIEEVIHEGSELIGLKNAYGINTHDYPDWAPEEIHHVHEEFEEAGEAAKANMQKLTVMVAEGDAKMTAYHEHILHLPAHFEAAHTAESYSDIVTLHSELMHIMDAMSDIFAYLRKYEEMKPLAADLIEIQLGLKQTASFFASYAMFEAAVLSFNASIPIFKAQSTYTTARCAEVATYWSEVTSLTTFLATSSQHDGIREFLGQFFDEIPAINAIMQPFIHCNFDALSSFPDFTALDESFERELEHLETKVIDRLLDNIAHNKEIESTALIEGMKLMGAIICSCVGLVIVIIMQLREREELFSIIDHSKKLQDAVRRFVPKNQLRVMGIRSVLEAEAGYCTEISQSLIFSDIRNFTTLSEKKTRQELFDWLQMYVARMTGAVQAEKGYIDKFIGDAVFAVYPAAPNAVASAMLMQEETDMMNVDLIAHKERDLIRIGIGVHHGIVMAGVFGDENRRSCTLIAPDVNLASRLESMSKPMGARIILSRAVMDQILVANYEIRSLGAVLAAGSGKKLEIFDLFQTDPENLKNFKYDTKKYWEKAVKLCGSTELEARAKATKFFEKIQHEADIRRVEDIGLNFKLLESKRSSSSDTVNLSKRVLERLDQGEEVSFSGDSTLDYTHDGDINTDNSFDSNDGDIKTE